MSSTNFKKILSGPFFVCNSANSFKILFGGKFPFSSLPCLATDYFLPFFLFFSRKSLSSLIPEMSAGIEGESHTDSCVLFEAYGDLFFLLRGSAGSPVIPAWKAFPGTSPKADIQTAAARDSCVPDSSEMRSAPIYGLLYPGSCDRITEKMSTRYYP